MAGNVQGQGRFTDWRPRRDYYQVGFLKTRKHVIQIREAGGNAAQFAIAGMQFFNAFKSIL